jgi:ribosomal protein S4E
MASEVRNGDICLVTAGTHKGKTGVVEDRNLSKGGTVTVTVRQADGTRFKTLERSVELQTRA